MAPFRWAALLRIHGQRAASTPSILSMLVMGSLFVLSLMLPERTLERTATAAQVERLAIAPAKPQRRVSLRDRLVVGLQARLKSEVKFVETVALRVQSGRLPQRVVDETFFWARARAAAGRSTRKRRAIIYFQPVMLARANRLGVSL